MKSESDGLLKISHVAELLNCSKVHVRRLQESGELPAIDISVSGRGRPCWRWEPSVVQRYLRDRG